MAKIKVAIVGYGHLGKWHTQKAAALSELCELVAIVEKFPIAQEAARAAHPSVAVVADLKEVLNKIDAAVVVTPTSFHFDVAHELLSAGKHVFCEKPLCSQAKDAQVLNELANRKKVILQVGHSERCHEVWEKLVSSWNRPTPFIARSERVAAFKGRATDVDVVQDLMIHDIDLMLYLFGRIPSRVQAHGLKLRTNYWDHVTAVFGFEDSSMATLTVGRNDVREVRQWHVANQNGIWLVDLFTNEWQFAPNTEVSPGVYTEQHQYNKRDHLLVEQEAFYRSISQNKPVMVDGKAGVLACQLVDAVLASLDSGAPVSFRG